MFDKSAKFTFHPENDAERSHDPVPLKLDFRKQTFTLYTVYKWMKWGTLKSSKIIRSQHVVSRKYRIELIRLRCMCRLQCAFKCESEYMLVYMALFFF